MKSDPAFAAYRDDQIDTRADLAPGQYFNLGQLTDRAVDHDLDIAILCPACDAAHHIHTGRRVGLQTYADRIDFHPVRIPPPNPTPGFRSDLAAR